MCVCECVVSVCVCECVVSECVVSVCVCECVVSECVCVCISLSSLPTVHVITECAREYKENISCI